MKIDGWTLLLQAINLVVLLALLRWLLYRPLMAVIEARRSQVDGELEQAAQARQTVEAQAQELQAQRAAMSGERERLLNGARREAEAERQAARTQNQAATAAALAEAQQAIAGEREAAANALAGEATQLAIELATRLLAHTPAPQGDGAFIEALLQRVDDSPAAERQAWFAPGAAPAVTLACAHPLDAPAIEQVRQRLVAALGPDLNLTVEQDPSLIRGAELRMAHGVLAHHWAGELADAQARLDSAEGAPA